MNPNHLRSFLAVRKHLSYTLAAQELFLSQPAVSRQIKQLEETLNVRLFEQMGKTLYLTDAGKILADAAQDILGSIERATEAVQAQGSVGSGTLRIGASTTPGLYLLPVSLCRFQEQYPKVNIQFVVQNSQRVEEMLLRNDLDLGFVGASLSSAAIEMKTVAGDEIICFAASTHRLAKMKRVNIGALLNETWIIRERGSATRKLFESWLDSTGGELRRTIVIHSSEEAKLLVDAGVGISLMSSLGLTHEIERGRFKRLKVAGLRLNRSIYMVKHVDKRTSPLMNAFLQLI
ncbi:MAG: LysR family transcriptional regulator [Proteobacteria bacterium]|nr:LysR family transcriptional regulator [Pseudomonadota bacterium]